MRFEKKEIDLTIIENSEGLLITQNGKTYLAEKWKLTEVVLEIINLSIENGFDKFWVHGHPKNGATKAHYICFSRSHDKPWEYLLGGEAKPPNVKYITVNKTHRKVLEVSGININWQEVGGKHIKYSPSIENFLELINKIKKYPHKAYKNNEFIDDSEEGTTGFKNEKNLENYLLSKYKEAGYCVDAQLSFLKNKGSKLNKDIPDLIFLNKKNVFIIELKLNVAIKSDIKQLNRYLKNKKIIERYKDKKIIGVLIAGYFHNSRIDETKLNYPYLNLYSFYYKNLKNNQIALICNYGEKFKFLYDFE